MEDISDDKLMKEIDAFMESEEREEMGHEEHLRRLLELNDKAALIHHPVAKVKRQKLLKQVKLALPIEVQLNRFRHLLANLSWVDLQCFTIWLVGYPAFPSKLAQAE